MTTTNRSNSLSSLPSPPGPELWRAMHAYVQDPEVYMHQLFLDYGDVAVWRGLITVYMLNNPDHVQQVLSQAYPEFTKELYDYRVLKQVFGNGLATNDGDDWARQRKLMQPMFHHKVINAYDEVINEYTSALASRWDLLKSDEPISLEREMSRLTFQIVVSTLFGSEIDEYVGEIPGIVDFININTKTPAAFFTLYPWIPTPHNLKFRKVMNRLDHIIYKVINAHRKRGQDSRDLLNRMLSARDEQSSESMSEKQIRDEVVTLMLTGHESSSTTLQWVFYALSQHPKVEAELLCELDAVLGGRPATGGDLAKLPYLKQVVQETMRLFPTAWGIARQSVYEQRFGNYRLPPKAYIAILPYSLHRHPDYWPDPERFDPSRFTRQNTQGRHPYCYIPFGGGPRTCIGAGMSMLEIQLILAQLLQHYRVRMLPGHPVKPYASITYRPRFGLKVLINPRRRHI